MPRQYSTDGKQTLLGISKRRNRYLRKLLVHGARSCFRHLDRTAIALQAGSTRAKLGCIRTRPSLL
ncbi:transposase [Bradyrhizobium sp. NC92]|uniref:transposase n=1 Tax=Bradyrhizobium sp. (strain NC92) TaxID=55395 RepID=UPI0021A9AC2E|nr:transposase [Bradyrhizobium sp. NC92]UWU72849.1 transposase [Bradyrhizobium sp. NC92]